jgi:hypothetical protein
MMKESPIFIKTYEIMVWLLRHTGKFPRNQRFLMAKRIEEATVDLNARALVSPLPSSFPVVGWPAIPT